MTNKNTWGILQDDAVAKIYTTKISGNKVDGKDVGVDIIMKAAKKQLKDLEDTKSDKDTREIHEDSELLDELIEDLKSRYVSEANDEEPLHRVSVTVSDPRHTAVSMRNTKIEKRIRLRASDKNEAMNKARRHYSKHGYKIHDVNHIEQVSEHVEIDESNDYMKDRKTELINKIKKSKLSAKDKNFQINIAKSHKNNDDLEQHHRDMDDLLKEAHYIVRADYKVTRSGRKYRPRRMVKDQEDQDKEEDKTDVSEAVGVDSTYYQNAHGKTPKGTGSWIFTPHRTLDFKRHKEGENYVSIHNSTYGDAKKKAQQWAASKGHSLIRVAEATELDEATVDVGDVHKKEMISQKDKHTLSKIADLMAKEKAKRDQPKKNTYENDDSKEDMHEDVSKWSTDKLQKQWDSHKDEERPSPTFASHLRRVAQELKKRKNANNKEHTSVHEEVEQLDEITKEGLNEADFATTMKKAIAAHERGDHTRAKYHLANAKTARYAMKSTEISKHKDLLDRYKELRDMHEEVEQLDEISKETLKSYIPKAIGSKEASDFMRGVEMATTARKDDEEAFRHKSNRRASGIMTAVRKLAKEESELNLEDFSLEELQDFMMSEDFEQLNELSKGTLVSYIKKASASGVSLGRSAGFELGAGASKRKSVYHKKEDEAEKRLSGIRKATDRLTREEVDTGEADARKTSPSSKDHNEKVFAKYRERAEKEKQEHEKSKKEEVEQLDELKKSTLASYVTKASNDPSRGAAWNMYYAGRKGASGHGQGQTAIKRMTGIQQAAKRLAKEDITEAELDNMINEVLSKDSTAGEWISDFVHSTDPRFKGKSKEKRKQMALAAYYAAQKNEDVEHSKALVSPGQKYAREDKESEDSEKEDSELDKPLLSIPEIAKKHKVSEEEVLKQLVAGMKVESEHTDDDFTALKIAAAHVGEKIDYYEKLKTCVEGVMSGKDLPWQKPGDREQTKTMVQNYKRDIVDAGRRVLQKAKDAAKERKNEDLEEATMVKKQNYSWGKMMTIHHGSDFSIPLHPEHQEAISKLKDEQEHKFKDETGRHWTARRKGDHVHFDTTGSGSMKTHVPYKHFVESAQLDEISDELLTRYKEKAKQHADELEAQKKFGKALKRRTGALHAVSRLVGSAGEKLAKTARDAQ